MSAIALPMFLLSESVSVARVAKPSLRAAPSITSIEILPEHWTEEALEERATRMPRHFLELLRGGQLDAVDTALAVEIAGRRFASRDVASTLVEFLGHDSALVREASIYALAEHGTMPGVVEAIRNHTRPESEPSPGVREAAADTLSFLD